MKLYYSPGACSLAPHIVLNELGQTYDLEKVDLGAKKTETGADFMDVNGKGYVPTLDLGTGEVLTEVSTILQYLADKAKNTDLLPAFGSMDRYRAMEQLNFVASELHKGIGGLFNPAMPEDGKKAIKDRLDAPPRLARRAAGEEALSAGRQIFRGRCLCLHRAGLDQACGHRPVALRPYRGLSRPRRLAPRRPGGDEEGRPGVRLPTALPPASSPGLTRDPFASSERCPGHARA